MGIKEYTYQDEGKMILKKDMLENSIRPKWSLQRGSRKSSKFSLLTINSR